tara:strand:- start:192 stop:767 length:576 start_codon:yes stop_codon:yes gene_type:complete
MDNWENSYLKNTSCDNVIEQDIDGDFIVRGFEPAIAPGSTVIFWAAAPPTYNGSFSGSGLPFPNPEIAYQNSVNKGSVKTVGGHYEFKIRFPNAYYVGLGSKYIEPCVHIKICQEHGEDKLKTIKLGNSIPFRSLTHSTGQRNIPARNNSSFYSGRDKLPTRTQEQILRDSQYPDDNKMSDNFWGKAVPHP